MSNFTPTMDVGRLRLLREVGLRGSIAAAARRMALTSSAVSQQLAVLEREAGTVLLDRSSRGVALTGAGLALAARAEELLDVLACARADLDRIAGAVAGPVNLVSVASAAASFVSRAATELRVDHPGILVSVTTAEPALALESLLAGDADLVVVDEYDYVPLALPDFVVAEELGSEPLVIVAPPGWLGPATPALAELAARPWVMPPQSAACGQAVRSACRAAGFEPAVRWETDDLLLLVRAVADGHGVAVLPRLSVADGIAEVDVRPLAEPPLRRRLMALARASTLARPVMSTVRLALASAAAASLRA